MKLGPQSWRARRLWMRRDGEGSARASSSSALGPQGTGARVDDRCLRWLAMAVALAAIAGSASAADEGPVFGRREKQPFLSLEPIHGSLELDNRYETDSTSSASAGAGSRTTSTHSTDLYTSQSLSLNTKGSIYHPNLLDFRLGGRFGLTEETVTGTDQASVHETGFLNEYNLDAAILKNSSTPLTLNADRAQSFLSRPFGGTIHQTSSDYGANLQLRSNTLPTTVQVLHTETQQRDVGTTTDQLDVTQNLANLHTTWRPTNRQMLSLDANYNNVTQTGATGQAYTSEEITATHDWQLDTDGFYTLTTNVDAFQQTGTFAHDRYHADTNLRLEHADWLSTHYLFSIEQQSINSSTQLSERARAGFTHRLFESLVTTGDLGYAQTDRSEAEGAGGGDRTYVGALALSYTKKVPYGRLSLDLSAAYTQRNWLDTGSTQTTLNQSEIFPDSTPVIITAKNIDASSVVITNLAGTRKYVAGTDYTVTKFNNRIEIRRAIVGAITDGQEVLVSYDTLPGGGSTTTTVNFGFGARYDIEQGMLKGLSLYGRYRQQNQTIDSSSSEVFFPENLRDYIVGAEYRIWRLTFSAEEESYDSSLSPYVATRFGARYSERLSANASLALTGSYSAINYTADSTHDNLLNINAALAYQISRTWTAKGTLLYRNEDSDRFAPSSGVDAQGELRWRYRQTQLYVILRDTLLDTTGSSSSSFSLQVGFQRDF